jgi:(R,R)-butanediol dehydrogenase/meso-butanediol dehydrogenase/diacetyl reductase
MKLEDIPEPVPGPEDVKVRIKFAGICHTDVYEYLYGPVTIYNPPLALGFEFSGIVEEAGSRARGWKKGDRVTGLPYYPCWTCHFCQEEAWNNCLNQKAHGKHINGVYAEYALFHHRCLYRLADSVSLEEAAAIAPMSVAMRAVNRAGMRKGESVFIVGAGPIGLALTMAARIRGAGKIIVSEPLEMRRSKALEVGATHVIDPGKETSRTRVRELTGSLGADISFDAVGSQATLDTASACTRRLGRVGIVGLFFEPTYAMSVMDNAIAGELSYFATQGFAGEMKEVVELVNGRKLRPGTIVSKVIPFSQIVEFIDQYEEKSNQFLKTLVQIG